MNISQHSGLRGKLITTLPWLFWSWYYSHGLELACKNSFVSPLCNAVLEMLLRLYLLYQKSPKRSSELMEIADDLREMFELPKGGDLTVRSCGTRWISHKKEALQQVLDHYGVYIHYLKTLYQDTSIKNDDRARLKGYLRQWQLPRILVGCGMFTKCNETCFFAKLDTARIKHRYSTVHRANFEGIQILKHFAGKILNNVQV